MISGLTVGAYHRALVSRSTTCTDTVNAYLARIDKYNPVLKAIINVNQDAIKIAREKDAGLPSLIQKTAGTVGNGTGAVLPPLHGAPIILKDTYSTHDMPTTSGVLALRNLTTHKDAYVVQNLRNAGAIILGKANLHEFSLHGTTTSSLGGQTLNPYDLSRTPGGSSGGTAVALAMDMCMLGCGGDTMNSLRSPASACSVVGFRPSAGLVSREGIVPVSWTQDVAGPIARNVRDVRRLFGVMRDVDGNDPAIRYDEYASTILQRSLLDRVKSPLGKRVRIGVLDSYFSLDDKCETSQRAESTTVKSITSTALETFKHSYPGVDLIHLPSTPTLDIPTLLNELDVQAYEFRTAFNTFLNSDIISSTPHRSLDSIAASGEYHHDAVTDVFHHSLQSGTCSPDSEEYTRRLARIETLKQAVDRLFDEHSLDVLAYPHQRQLATTTGTTVQPNRNGILAALTGCPAICLSAGFSEPMDSATRGVPIGIEFMGRQGRDYELLEIAGWFEELVDARNEPDLAIL